MIHISIHTDNVIILDNVTKTSKSCVWEPVFFKNDYFYCLRKFKERF